MTCKVCEMRREVRRNVQRGALLRQGRGFWLPCASRQPALWAWAGLLPLGSSVSPSRSHLSLCISQVYFSFMLCVHCRSAGGLASMSPVPGLRLMEQPPSPLLQIAGKERGSLTGNQLPGKWHISRPLTIHWADRVLWPQPSTDGSEP